MPIFLVFSLTRTIIELEFTVSVAGALFTQPLIGNRLSMDNWMQQPIGCDHRRRKSEGFAISATLPTVCFKKFGFKRCKK